MFYVCFDTYWWLWIMGRQLRWAFASPAGRLSGLSLWTCMLSMHWRIVQRWLIKWSIYQNVPLLASNKYTVPPHSRAQCRQTAESLRGRCRSQHAQSRINSVCGERQLGGSLLFFCFIFRAGFYEWRPRAGSGCKNGPAAFPGRMS